MAYKRYVKKALKFLTFFILVYIFARPWVGVESHTVMVLDEKTQLPVEGVAVIRLLSGRTGQFQTYSTGPFYQEMAITDKNGLAHFKGMKWKQLPEYFIWNFSKNDMRIAQTLLFKYGYYPNDTHYYWRDKISDMENRLKPNWVVDIKNAEIEQENNKIKYMHDGDAYGYSVALGGIISQALNSCPWQGYQYLLAEYDHFKQEQEKYIPSIAMYDKQYAHWYQAFTVLNPSTIDKSQCKITAYQWLEENRKHVNR